MIAFELYDNGIGLTASHRQKKDSEKTHESLAINICKKRLAILQKKWGGEITFVLEEMIADSGETKGTRVAFNIPI
jgi:tRNA A37 threonylcarbamoyladenosine synthetase subunit TsaC/SUA5/YrdC